MATANAKVDSLAEDEVYSTAIQATNTDKTNFTIKSTVLDFEKPDITVHGQLRIMQQEIARMMGISFEMHRLSLNQQGITDNGILSDVPGEKMTVQQADKILKDEIAEFYKLNRELQLKNTKVIQRTTDAFVTIKEPICEIPAKIKEGTNDQISDSGLKLLTTFKGEGESAAENLRSFLREVYNVAVTNKLTEATTVEVLLRKLQGTARQLTDNFIATEEKVPSLQEVVLMLEENYMSGWSPEVASAKLNLYTKRPTESYSQMQGEIAELTSLAARGIDQQSRKQWIKQKKVATFLQAISAEDRDLIYKENQSRRNTSVPEMNMEQMARHLITYHAQTEAFVTVSQLQTKGDTDSIQQIAEKPLSRNQRRRRAVAARKATEQAMQIQQGSYNNQPQGTLPNQNNFHNQQQGNGANQQQGNFTNQQQGFFPNHQGQFQHQQQFQNSGGNFNNNQGRGRGQNYNRGRGRNNNRGGMGGTKPRVFVTHDMVNVSQHACLKCGAMDHKFQETDKCAYGVSKLLSQACFNCKTGGHHHKVCIKPAKPNVGAPAAMAPPTPPDPKFSAWPEQTKNIPEQQRYENFQPEKNPWGPSLFNN